MSSALAPLHGPLTDQACAAKQMLDPADLEGLPMEFFGRPEVGPWDGGLTRKVSKKEGWDGSFHVGGGALNVFFSFSK